VTAPEPLDPVVFDPMIAGMLHQREDAYAQVATELTAAWPDVPLDATTTVTVVVLALTLTRPEVFADLPERVAAAARARLSTDVVARVVADPAGLVDMYIRARRAHPARATPDHLAGVGAATTLAAMSPEVRAHFDAAAAILRAEEPSFDDVATMMVFQKMSLPVLRAHYAAAGGELPAAARAAYEEYLDGVDADIDRELGPVRLAALARLQAALAPYFTDAVMWPDPSATTTSASEGAPAATRRAARTRTTGRGPRTGRGSGPR